MTAKVIWQLSPHVSSSGHALQCNAIHCFTELVAPWTHVGRAHIFTPSFGMLPHLDRVAP